MGKIGIIIYPKKRNRDQKNTKKLLQEKKSQYNND